MSQSATDSSSSEALPSGVEDDSTSLAITQDQAVDIALADAGLSQTEISNLEVRLDTENGVQVYEVEFNYQNREFSYEIDATNGNILNNEMDID